MSTADDTEAFCNQLHRLNEQLTFAIRAMKAGTQPNPNSFVSELDLAATTLNQFPAYQRAVLSRAREFYKHISSGSNWNRYRHKFLSELRHPDCISAKPKGMESGQAEALLKKWINTFADEKIGLRTIQYVHSLFRGLRDDFFGWTKIQGSTNYRKIRYLTLRLSCDPLHLDAIGYVYFRLAEPAHKSVAELNKLLLVQPSEVWPSLQLFVERLLKAVRADQANDRFKTQTPMLGANHTLVAISRIASSQISLKTPENTWPPGDGWHFRSGEAAYLRVVFPITGKLWGVLKALAETAGPVEWGQLAAAVSPDTTPNQETIKGYVSKVRNALRNVFNLDSSIDPIPNVEWGKRTSWKLDFQPLQIATEKQR